MNAELAAMLESRVLRGDVSAASDPAQGARRSNRRISIGCIPLQSDNGRTPAAESEVKFHLIDAGVMRASRRSSFILGCHVRGADVAN